VLGKQTGRRLWHTVMQDPARMLMQEKDPPLRIQVYL
jgi:hypothetical protein